MQSKDLPDRASLDHYKKQAKELLKRVVSGESQAIEFVRRAHPRLGTLSAAEVRDTSKLSDIQFVVAREHGYESWPSFSKQLREASKPKICSGHIPLGGVDLLAEFATPGGVKSIVLLLHTRSSGRLTHQSNYLVECLTRVSLGVISVDLLSPSEAVQDVETDEIKHDLRLLGSRIAEITAWLSERSEYRDLSVGYMGSDTAAAAAAYSASEWPSRVRALVFNAGRPDLAGPWLWRVKCPTLFLVGEKATIGRAFNRSAMKAFSPDVPTQFSIVPGAGERLEDDDALKQCARLSCDWFSTHLR